MKHALIIGAGGVASYLLPVLIKTFRPAEITIVDKDILEKRNLDRQMFRDNQVGVAKAKALSELYPGPKYNILVDWFSDGMALPAGIDAIFGCADNHRARYDATLTADTLGCYAYIGGNEYVDAEAWVWHRAWKNTPRDFLMAYRNIMTDETGSPFRCTGEAQEAAPQLAMANLSCASQMLRLAWCYEQFYSVECGEMMPSEREKLLPSLPVELFSGLSSVAYTTAFTLK